VKKILLVVGLLVALGTLGTWLGTGAHRGWTKTSVTVVEIEPVTGLENPVPKKQFVMGVELLGLGLLAAGALVGVSFFFKSKSNKPTKTTSD
jgi:hypothetical protein